MKPPGGRAWRWAFGLAAASLLLYIPSLSGDFVLDDYRNIQSNPWLATPANWPSFFYDPQTTHSLPLNASYRPLLTLSLALNAKLGGPNPFWFHLTDAAVHAANVALVFGAGLALSGSAPAAAAGAALFALHPAQVESVAYIDGARPNVCSLFFCLLAFLAYRRGRLGQAAGLFACGLLFKENSAAFPLWLAAYDLALAARRSWTRRLREWTPFGAVLAAYLVVRRLVLGAAGQGDWAGAAGYIGRIAGSLATDARLLAAPSLLTHCRSAFAPAWPATGLVFLLAGGLVAAAFLLSKKQRLEGIGLAWFLLALLPVSQLVPLYIFAADRFLYWPLAGLSVALAGLLARRSPLQCAVVAAALALGLAPSNLERQLAWQDQFNLDADSYAAAHDDPCTSLALAYDYFNWGMSARTAELLGQSLSPSAPPALRHQATLIEKRLEQKRLWAQR